MAWQKHKQNVTLKCIWSNTKYNIQHAMQDCLQKIMYIAGDFFPPFFFMGSATATDEKVF